MIDIPMLNQKKSQLTIIIIAGVALLLIATFFLFSAKQATETKTKQGTKQVYTSQQDTSQVTSFVQSCLDSALRSGLETVGQQGGVAIVSGFEGASYIQKGSYKIPYGIRKDEDSLPPAYPSVQFPYGPTDQPTMHEAPSGRFRFSTLDKFHESLLSLTTENFNTCINGFRQFIDEGMTVTAGEMESTLTIGVSDVVFAINYPLTIKNAFANEQNAQSRFSSMQNIRLEKMQQAMEALLSSDVNDIAFDITTYSLPDGILLSVEHNAYRNNDIITLTDTQSTLNGKSYELRSARQNRNPALHYVAVLSDPLVADDPDEDAVSFATIGTRIEVSDGELTDFQDIP